MNSQLMKKMVRIVSTISGNILVEIFYNKIKHSVLIIIN